MTGHTTCNNCSQGFDISYDDNDDLTTVGAFILESDAGYYHLCSVSCLTEFAWKQRETQPKLSKSKEGP